MKKQISACILAAFMLTSAFALTNCDISGNHSSNNGANSSSNNSSYIPNPSTPSTPQVTYKGKLLEKSYANKQEALQDFVVEQINGGATAAEFVSSETLGIIPEADYDQYELGDMDKAEIVSIERVKVFYRDAGKDQNKDVGVASIIDNTYRLLALPMQTGETLTEDYFETIRKSTLNSGSVTMSLMPGTTCTVTSDYSAMGSGIITETVTEMTVYITADAFYSYKKKTVEMSGQSVAGVDEMYIIRHPNDSSKYLCAVNSGSWQVMEYPVTIEFPSIKTSDPQYLFAAMALNELGLTDHSYYTKTADGFTMNPDKPDAFLEDCLSIIYVGDSTLGDMINLEDLSITLNNGSFNNFIVTNNRISGYHFNTDIDMSFKVYGTSINMPMKMSANYMFSNYGNTTIIIPENIQALFNQYVAANNV